MLEPRREAAYLGLGWPSMSKIGSFRWTSPLRIFRLKSQSGLVHTQAL